MRYRNCCKNQERAKMKLKNVLESTPEEIVGEERLQRILGAGR
jgi:hypothetical protein